MLKPARTEYCIKSCPVDDTAQFELLLNTMSKEGWELFSMHEAEAEEEGYQYNCIFSRDEVLDELTVDGADIFSFKTKMERIMTPKSEPVDLCLDIQKKIKEKRAKIAKIKSLLDSTSEDSRKSLNDEISVNINELEDLKKKLFRYMSPDIMYKKLGEDKLSISLSEELSELVNPDDEFNLITQTVQVRQNLTEKLGYVIPEIKFLNGDDLQENEVAINVRGIPAVKATCYPGYVMYFKHELNLEKLPKNTIKDTDPITNRKIVWIEEEKTADFWKKGLDSNAFIARLLEHTAVKCVNEIFDYSDVNKLIEIVALENLYLIENIIPDYISIGEIKYLLTGLIRERVSIKDIMFIFEKINDFASDSSKEDLLANIRQSLSRQITMSRADSEGVVNVIELSEDTVSTFTGDEKDEKVIKIESREIEKLIRKFVSVADENGFDLKDLTIVAPYELRQIIFIVLSKFSSNITVVAREELTTDYRINVVGKI